MIQTIQNWVAAVSEAVARSPFFFGFLTGLAALLAVLLLLAILWLLLAPRKLGCIVVSSEGGELRIDAKAVQGSVLAVASNIPAFTVRKVSLYGKQAAPELLIQLDYNGGESVATLAARFRAAVNLMMTDTFGMEKPAKIELEVVRSFADAPALPAEVPAEPAESAPSAESGEPGTGTSC